MEEITQNMPPSSQHRPYSHKVLTLLFLNGSSNELFLQYHPDDWT